MVEYPSSSHIKLVPHSFDYLLSSSHGFIFQCRNIRTRYRPVSFAFALGDCLSPVRSPPSATCCVTLKKPIEQLYIFRNIWCLENLWIEMCHNVSLRFLPQFGQLQKHSRPDIPC